MSNPFLDVLNKQNTPHTPIWLMRQAGRYLPEYLKIRETAGSFMNLCTNPELACEVTLQPLRRFNLDAAILFSDILVIPDAMGLGLHFIENEGPKFTHPIKTEADIDNLSVTNVIERLSYVFQTITNLKSELKPNIPLIGFSGSPFTLMCYMLEGGSSKNYITTKSWLIKNPAYAHKLLTKITEAVILYLSHQIQTGVDAFMIFDSWGGVLSESHYLEFSLPYINKIISTLQNSVPSIVFVKGGANWMKHLVNMNATAYGLDWTVNIGNIRQETPDAILQGNLDPVILAVGDKYTIKHEVQKIFQDYVRANNGNISNYIFNLGHGILPITPPDNVAYLVDIVHEISSKIQL